MNLQVVFWFGWIVSGILCYGFVVWLVLVRFKKRQSLTAAVSSLTGHAPSLTSPFSPVSMLTSAVLLAGGVVSRQWLSGSMFGPWYFADEALDSCIMPYQLSRHEGIWAGNANFLTYLIYLMGYRMFGFGPWVARDANIFFFSIATVVFFWALHRLFGKDVGWFVAGMMLISSPFIIHSIYATAITFSLLPIAVILWILSGPVTDRSAALLGPVLVSGLYLYPAAFLTGICLIYFHSMTFSGNWPRKTRFIFLVTFVISFGLAYYLRRTMTGNPDWQQWGGGLLSFEQIGQHSLVVLKDTFWESLSWNTLTSRAPYFDTAMAGFLIIGVASALIPSRFRPPVSERKWIWVCLGGFLGSVVLSALGRDYPGVRRVICALPLLYIIAGLGVRHVMQWTTLRPFLWGAIIVCFGLVTWQSYLIAQKSWPLSGQSDFMAAARDMFLQKGDGRQEIVILAYNSDQYLAQHYRCALSLDDTLNGRFQSVRVIHRSRLEQRQDVPGNFVLLANELFSSDQLEGVFGLPPRISTIRRPVTSPRPELLVAIYEFTQDPEPRREQ